MARDKPKGLIVGELGEGGDGVGKRAGGKLLALCLNRGQVGPHLDEGEAASDGDVDVRGVAPVDVNLYTLSM